MVAPENAQEELEKYGQAQVSLPRIAIKFCVQCKWNLRAAYYAQELLSTFSTALGEVSLIPATGGTFTITLLGRSPHPSTPKESTLSGRADSSPPVTEVLLWDRKIDGGFPETKELKNRVRNLVEPGRDLGHVDRSLKKAAAAASAAKAELVAEVKPSSIEGSSGDGGPASSDGQGDAVMPDAGPTIPAEKCEDC